MKSKFPRLKTVHSEEGFLTIAALGFLIILILAGITGAMLSSTDIGIGGNYKNSREVLQAAIAGAEHGREILRQKNASNTAPFTDTTSFNSELVYYVQQNNNPLITGTLGGYAYTVSLSNDVNCPPYCDYTVTPPGPFDPGGSTADSNNKVLIISTATGPNNAKATVELAVALPPPPAAPPPLNLPTPPALITLLGNSESFMGNNSNAKSLNGADQCGNGNPLPVVAANDAASLPGIKDAINDSKPKTYHTMVNGQLVDASTNMNDIAKNLTGAQMNNNGTILNDAGSLNSMVQQIQGLPQTTTVPGGSDDSNVNLGDANNLKVVVVDGDFTMNGNASGAGLLVVKGQLTFHGTINYTGMIMVIGTGAMIRNGQGNGTISGAVWVANTVGADGVPNTPDDAMGPAIFNTSGGGASNVQFCSSAVNNAVDATAPPPTYAPLTVKSYRQILTPG